MAKIYLIIFPLIVICNCLAQCPFIDGAMSYEVGASEGINEYVFFATTDAGIAADYTLYYGSGTTPAKPYSFNVTGNGNNAQVVWKTVTELSTS